MPYVIKQLTNYLEQLPRHLEELPRHPLLITLAAVLSLLSGDAQPYLDIMQRTTFSNQELIDSRGPYNNDVELIAAIRKQSGDDSLANDLMQQPQNKNRVVQCLKYPQAVNPDCLLWLYLDGKRT